MKPLKYCNESLKQFCLENGVELCRDYSGEVVRKDTKIEGKCTTEGCDDIFNKSFREIVTHNNIYCKKCTYDNAKMKRQQTCLENYGVESVMQNNDIKNKCNPVTKYTHELLAKIVDERKLILLKNYDNERIHAHYIIEGKCITENCNNTFSKPLYKLLNVNYFCKPCTYINAKEIRKQTNLKNIGTENYFQSNNVKEQIKATNLQKYGVEYCAQSQHFKDKFKETCLKNFGVPHPLKNKIITEKIKNTNIQKYGVNWSMQSDIVKNTSIINAFKKYGVSHYMQIPEHAENVSKACYLIKYYILPSGNIIKYQGYEHFALDELLKTISEEHILNSKIDVPDIWYNDIHGKKRRHYVDIFIPSQNRCIEVKSTWTIEKIKENIFLKQQAAKELGYNYEIWVYNNKGVKTTCYQ
jgi:hypothetical protein